MIPSKELTQFSVTTAAVLISLGIGRTAQTAKDTYLIMGNQPFSTNSLSSGAEAEAEAEAEAAVESARRHLATVDNSIEPEWLLDVPGSNQHFGMGLTDQERESILKRFSGKNITYTQAALNEPNDVQAFAVPYMRGKNSTTMKGKEDKAHNNASDAYITPGRIAESIKDALSEIPSLFEGKSERACH